MHEDIYDYMNELGLIDPNTRFSISRRQRRLSERELQIVDDIGAYIVLDDLYDTTPFPDLGIHVKSHFTLMIEYEDRLTGKINTSVADFIVDRDYNEFYFVNCKYARYNDFVVNNRDLIRNIHVHSDDSEVNISCIDQAAYTYLYEAHFKHIPLNRAINGPLDDNIITDFSKMILFPNIITAEEVFRRRAQEMNVSLRYVQLALENYKNKLLLDEV